MKSNNELSEQFRNHINVFHNLMIDILRRRELFRAFEKNLIGKKITPQSNAFISFYIMDYLRGQFIDLRKFFETDGRSYKISFITDNLISQDSKIAYEKLLTGWKVKFEKQANKRIFHLDKDKDEFPTDVIKKELDLFINDINAFLDDIIISLRKEGHDFGLDKKFRDLNGDFLKKEVPKDFTDYLIIAN